jgi:tetratricopeptide (TPR) repeat protein
MGRKMVLDPREDPNLTLEALDRVEDLCNSFERQWRLGDRVAIEDLLADTSGLQRSISLRELLALELESRLLAGERPAPAEYLRRFPAHSEIIDLIFRETETNDTGEPSRLLPKLPCILDDYELVEEVARGGMGVVYRARQLSLNRTVAVKMILAGQFASDADVERFDLEVQAAAWLDHPNIVPIIEVGRWQGQRYFSMSFIDGVSLASRIAAGPLRPREAARLLLTVAEAVEYAHSRGIVHRDLKPANILIEADGRPHITDFGLAKRVRKDDALTATGQLIGTPSFMPPEQAMGKSGLTGALSDVYSLGAVLYAMLTGRPPFQAASAFDTVKQVLEQEPVAPRRLNPTVPRDLETVALKCLEKNPAKRYGSARDLAEELRRYLCGRPIVARPVKPLERAYRWCRRNPVVAAMASAVTLLLLAVTVVSTASAVRIDRLRLEAIEHEQVARAQSARAESERAKAERNLQYAHDMIRQLADSYNLLGDQQQRIEHRLQWYEKAHGLFSSLAHESPSSLDSQAQLAGSFGRLGMAHARAGSSSNAMEAFDHALAILQRLCQQHPEQLQYQRDLAKAFDLLGRQYRLDARHDASLAMHEQACRVQERLMEAEPAGSGSAGLDLAIYYHDLATLQHDLDHFAKSRASFERARQRLEPLAARHPGDMEMQAALADLYCDIGARRASSDSKHMLARSREILQAVVRSRPEESGYRCQLAKVLRSTAVREQQAESALAWQLQCHDVWDRLVHDFPTDVDIKRSSVWSLSDNARFLWFVGRRQEATDALNRALDQMGAVFTEDAPTLHADFEVRVLAMLARSKLQLGDAPGYRQHCRAIMAHCDQRNNYENDLLRVCMLLPDALDDPEQLVHLTKDAATQGSRTLRKKANIGGALYRAGEYEEAIHVLTIVEESNRLALMARLGTAEIVRADNARVALFLSMAHARLGRSSGAQSWLDKARRWIEGEGRLFVAANAPSAGEAGLASAADPSITSTPTVESSVSALGGSPRGPDIEDRIFLADIVFELQMLLAEAQSPTSSFSDAP